MSDSRLQLLESEELRDRMNLLLRGMSEAEREVRILSTGKFCCRLAYTPEEENPLRTFQLEKDTPVTLQSVTVDEDYETLRFFFSLTLAMNGPPEVYTFSLSGYGVEIYLKDIFDQYITNIIARLNSESAQSIATETTLGEITYERDFGEFS